MATNRLNRINEDIQRELSVLIPRVKDPRVQQGMVTVTGVETTPICAMPRFISASWAR